jgi:hypothetical protein
MNVGESREGEGRRAAPTSDSLLLDVGAILRSQGYTLQAVTGFPVDDDMVRLKLWFKDESGDATLLEGVVPQAMLEQATIPFGDYKENT